MAIWYDRFPIAYANDLSKETLIENLGIVLEEVGNDYLSARMPVDSRTRQPAGILHGGASVAFAETLASWAATYTVNRNQHYCVGLEINANHLRAVGEGFVHGIARPIHLGRKNQVWEVRIADDQGKQVCVARITMAILDVSD
jgi:1,4-dihydroxy-2-naphthoyl-CoA hydrolase